MAKLLVSKKGRLSCFVDVRSAQDRSGKKQTIPCNDLRYSEAIGETWFAIPWSQREERSTSKGNFLEFCDFLSSCVDSFKEMQQQYFNFSSPQCQNDIINICSTAVQNEIVNAIRRVGFFTIIAAEVRSSETEYLSQCV